MITSDVSVAKADVRYPNCAVQIFNGKPTLLLNPKEPNKFKFFSFQLSKAKIILSKIKAIEEFYNSSGKKALDGVEVFDYRSNQMILLNPESSPRFQFGIDKAYLIMNRIQAIRNFVAIYSGVEGCKEFGLVPPE